MFFGTPRFRMMTQDSGFPPTALLGRDKDQLPLPRGLVPSQHQPSPLLHHQELLHPHHYRSIRQAQEISTPAYVLHSADTRRRSAALSVNMAKIAALALLAGLGLADELYTPKHEPGRCAIRDHCGKKSFFGKELPCVDNGLAEEPDKELRKQLVDLCGPKWNDIPVVCCTKNQVGLSCCCHGLLFPPTNRRISCAGRFPQR